MDLISAITLGIVQGLTEFLPISSSAHLVIAEKLLGFHEKGIFFEILVHCATLLSVCIYFSKKIKLLWFSCLGMFFKEYRLQYYNNKGILWGIVVGTIPTAIIGYCFNDYIDGMFSNVTLVGYALILTSIFLLISDYFKPKGNVSPSKALIIGIFQGMAVIPGISRSGITISTSIMLNVKRVEAAEFSFLLSIPSIIGAIILKYNDINIIVDVDLKYYIISAFIAFLVGLISIYMVINVVKYANFRFFALYCLILGIYTIIWL